MKGLFKKKEEYILLVRKLGDYGREDDLTGIRRLIGLVTGNKMNGINVKGVIQSGEYVLGYTATKEQHDQIRDLLVEHYPKLTFTYYNHIK